MNNIFSGQQIGEVRYREPMKYHTTFEVGGSCDVMIIPHTTEEVLEALRIIRQHALPFRVIGNGSNLLVRDKGLREVVIKLHDAFSDIQVTGTTVTAKSGALLKDVAYAALEHGLTGMEALSGIPGDVGGAVTMNAGAYGGEIKDVLLHCKVANAVGEISILSKEEMALSYRRSIVQTDHLIVLEATFQLQPGDQAIIRSTMDDFHKRRQEKQPLEYASAGSTFKRPEGYFAGKLIQDAGLRGYTYRNAKISDKHCGFVINTGGATFEEVQHVMKHAQAVVYEKFHVKLEPEVRIIGEE